MMASVHHNVMTCNFDVAMGRALDGIVEAGLETSRSSCVRNAIRDLLVLDDDMIADVVDAADRSPFKKFIMSLNLPQAFVQGLDRLFLDGIGNNRSDLIRIACARFIEVEQALGIRLQTTKSATLARTKRRPPRLDMRTIKTGWEIKNI
jgi:metal-responsive CopG/Arc/MetJ family transcriptional regulator